MAHWGRGCEESISMDSYELLARWYSARLVKYLYLDFALDCICAVRYSSLKSRIWLDSWKSFGGVRAVRIRVDERFLVRRMNRKNSDRIHSDQTVRVDARKPPPVAASAALECQTELPRGYEARGF